MPTPRQHGGAALTTIPLTLPGFKGLNTTQKTGILGPEWATALYNSVIDDNSRVAARMGWDVVTTTPAGEAFVQLYSQVTASGTERIIAASATKLYSSSNGGSTWTDVTAAIGPPTAGEWQFTTFNDICYGIQSGYSVIKSTTGNFTAVASSPTGNCILGAFGRCWATDSDGTTLHYSALLNGDTWTGADTGTFDLTNVWPDTDTITALAAFNNSLVIFGRNNIVIYADPAGSVLGIDPTAMYVVDIITGTGCVARDSVQSVNGDLWFLSRTGVQSLGRLIQQKNNPIFNLSRNVQDDVKHFLDQMTSVASLRSVYSPANKLYLLSFPVSGSTGGAIAFDTRGLLEDGSARCMGLWTLIPTALCRTFDDTILSAIDGQTGYVGAYSGASDNGAEYLFTYESAWLDLTDRSGYLLIAKRLAGTFFTDTSISLIFKWAFDFTESFYTYSTNLDGPGDLAEFGIAEFGIAEFGGGTALRTSKIPASGTGQYIRLGIDAPINGQTFSVQQLNVFCKIGRYA